MKAILFLATLAFSNLAFATPATDSGVSVTPNGNVPNDVVDVRFVGSPAEDLYNAMTFEGKDVGTNTGIQFKQSGPAVCIRRVVANEAKQASVMNFECVITVARKK